MPFMVFSWVNLCTRKEKKKRRIKKLGHPWRPHLPSPGGGLLWKIMVENFCEVASKILPTTDCTKEI